MFIAQLLRSIFNQPCSHAFSWPHLHPAGGYYQVCVWCGDHFAYDWGTMVRREKIATAAQPGSSTTLAEPQTWIPREVGQSQYGIAMVENISKSGILFECQARLTEGTTAEMILEMPEEICGQRNKHVICRGEVVRTAASSVGTFVIGVAISGYSFLPETAKPM